LQLKITRTNLARERPYLSADVIGDYLTEINVTSPTCIREIGNAFGAKSPNN
jgi:glutathione synthase/RimK-type ligase-like ATP-grasp enzyme